MNTMKLKKSDVAPILALIGGRAATYRGRKFKLELRDSYSLNNGDLVWDGGSKLEVTFLRYTAAPTESTALALPGQKVGLEIVDAASAMECPVTGGAQNLNVAAIPPNVMIVEHSHFCGKDMGFRFIVSKNSKLLPPGFVAVEGKEISLALPAAR